MNAVILDNWTFQTIGELFANGLDKHRTQALVVKGKQHAYEPAVIGNLQLAAVTDLITNLLLRDQILLDTGFVHAWAPFEATLRTRCGRWTGALTCLEVRKTRV